MYLLVWGSFPSRLRHDENLCLQDLELTWWRYGREKRLPEGWQHHLLLKTPVLDCSDVAAEGWRLKSKMFLLQVLSVRTDSGCLRGASWSLSRTLRLKPVYAMDETSGLPLKADTDFAARRKTTVEVEVVECSCFHWRWFLLCFQWCCVTKLPVTWLRLELQKSSPVDFSRSHKSCHQNMWCNATGRGAGWSPVEYGVGQST